MKRLFVLLSLFATAIFAITGNSTHAAPASDQVELTVIHGIPNLPMPVEVFANNDYLFSFDFEEMVGPISLPEGNYFLEVRLDGRSVLAGDTQLESGKNYSVIAHLTYMDGEEPGLRLSLFENDITPMTYPRSRYTLRHTAYAPTVDAEVWKRESSQRLHLRAPEVSNLDSNEPVQFGPTDFPSGYYETILFPTGTQQEVFRSEELYLRSNQSSILYAVGSIADGTFTMLVQSIRLDLPSKVTDW